MKLRLPTIDHETAGTGLAPRQASLAGLRVGLLDGWGDQTDSGIDPYPAMAEISRLLTADYGVVETIWQLKPSVSHPVPLDDLREFAGRVDVVVNGEGL